MNINVEIKRILWITLGTLIFSVGISYFIVPADLIPGGITGFARLSQYGATQFGVTLNLGLWIVILNIPIMVLGLKGISKRFVYYSTFSIVLQGILIGLFEANPIIIGEEILAMIENPKYREAERTDHAPQGLSRSKRNKKAPELNFRRFFYSGRLNRRGEL